MSSEAAASCEAEEAGGGADVEVGGAAALCWEEEEEGGGAEWAPAEATASGGWYCSVACTPSRAGIEDSCKCEHT